MRWWSSSWVVSFEPFLIRSEPTFSDWTKTSHHQSKSDERTLDMKQCHIFAKISGIITAKNWYKYSLEICMAWEVQKRQEKLVLVPLQMSSCWSVLLCFSFNHICYILILLFFNEQFFVSWGCRLYSLKRYIIYEIHGFMIIISSPILIHLGLYYSDHTLAEIKVDTDWKIT